jgi:transcriptional regulator with XRE-family HTH domain
MEEEHKTPFTSTLARHLGARAREARLRAGLSQAEVAERADLVTEVYGRLERGKMLPSVPSLLRVCRALGVDANTLLGFASTAPPPWLAPAPGGEAEPPHLRGLMSAGRQLKPSHLRLLLLMANAFLSASNGRPARKRRRKGLE